MTTTLSLGKLKINVLSLLPVIFLFFFNPPEYVGAVLFCAFLHETGHLIAIKSIGLEVYQIKIMLFGAEIKLGDRLCTYENDAFIYSAGAIANLVGAVCSYFMYLFIPTNEILFLLFANLFYGIFNLLPIRGLDGGGLLESLLLTKNDPTKAWRICDKISAIFIILMFVFSVWVIAASGYNFSMIFVMCYLFINL